MSRKKSICIKALIAETQLSQSDDMEYIILSDNEAKNIVLGVLKIVRDFELTAQELIDEM